MRTDLLELLLDTDDAPMAAALALHHCRDALAAAACPVCCRCWYPTRPVEFGVALSHVGIVPSNPNPSLLQVTLRCGWRRTLGAAATRWRAYCAAWRKSLRCTDARAAHTMSCRLTQRFCHSGIWAQYQVFLRLHLGVDSTLNEWCHSYCARDLPGCALKYGLDQQMP